MKRLIRTLAMSVAACAIGLYSATSSVAVAAEARTTDAGSITEWKQWVKENAKPIASIEAEPARSERTPSDRFSDLQFLKPILQDKRMVSLGEASHGAAEYNSAKVRMVQFLHEEMGYDVIAFESNLGDAGTAYAQLDSDSPEDTMKKAIFGVWNVKENLPLFEYIAQQSKTDRPLILTGFDVQGTSEPFISFVEKWFSTVDKSKATSFARTERWYLKVHGYDDLQRFNLEQPQLMAKYRLFQQFVQENKVKLQAVYPAHPELVPMLERVLQNRIDMLDSYCGLMVKLFAGIEPDSQLKEASYMRDQQMANNVKWLAETLYPDKKMILWAHNYHIRKHNSTMITEHNGFGFDNNPYPTMGELLPFPLQQDNYVIGLYAYQGSSNKNNKQAEMVSLPHAEGSVEDIMKIGEEPALFVDMEQEKLGTATSWMFIPRIAKSWGVLEEELIIRDQYDGLLFIDTIHPSRRLP